MIKKSARPKITILSTVENIIKEEKSLWEQLKEIIEAVQVQNQPQHEQTMGIIDILKNQENSDKHHTSQDWYRLIISLVYLENTLFCIIYSTLHVENYNFVLNERSKLIFKLMCFIQIKMNEKFDEVNILVQGVCNKSITCCLMKLNTILYL